VRAELGWIQPDARHPLMNEPGVLPCCKSRGRASTRKQVLTRLSSGQSQVLIDSRARSSPSG
jgi:hypothetical protein